MDGDEPQDRKGFGWGIAISLVLHALAALMLTGVISGYVSQPIEDTVEVELVPPPEQTSPPAVPEEPEPEEPDVPEPEQAEPAVAPPPPPPAPPPAPQQPEEAATPPADVPVLQPVEEFGEEDTGPVGEETPPEEPAEAEAPEEPVEPAEPVENEEPAEAETALETEAEVEAAEEAAAGEADPADAADIDTAEAQEDTEAEPDPVPVPEDAPQESDTADTPVIDPAEETEAASGTEAETDIGIAEITAPEDFGVVGPIVTEATPAPKPARAAQTAPAARRETARTGASGPPAGMLAARQLYSRDILDAPQARTAMRGMSEGQRLNLLCMTELRAQISSVSALPPELLPRFRPPPGNVLQPKTAAFRSLGRWFDVSFRCETDSGVTRVENFAFKIGNEIPQSQWLERGLTGF
ncbi:DUF930 domain-containing protein [Roseibium sp. AS2]|uniref:DUF930 domain-containing protein n=1 Tax=Roseibium sp. AS2 TaxID=3135781 RepID=UPI00316E1768